MNNRKVGALYHIVLLLLQYLACSKPCSREGLGTASYPPSCADDRRTRSVTRWPSIPHRSASEVPSRDRATGSDASACGPNRSVGPRICNINPPLLSAARTASTDLLLSTIGVCHTAMLCSLPRCDRSAKRCWYGKPHANLMACQARREGRQLRIFNTSEAC